MAGIEATKLRVDCDFLIGATAGSQLRVLHDVRAPLPVAYVHPRSYDSTDTCVMAAKLASNQRPHCVVAQCNDLEATLPA